MTRRGRSLPLSLALAFLVSVLAATPLGPGPVRGAEYDLESAATYEVEPAAGRIEVSVEVEFTNTTPDPAGQFSVFDEVKLAVHDEATDVTATDDEGDLPVAVATEEDVNVATVELREAVRFEESAVFELRYTLPDSGDPQLRVRPSVVVFPAWSFGTAGTVAVMLPAAYEVRVDGDPLTAHDGEYVSGPIADPSRWLALVTALRPAEFRSHDATIPLSGGTANLRVRAFADDEAWGSGMRDLIAEALPLLEAELGLPYPLIGQLVVSESVPAEASDFGESAAGGTEILVAYDQPRFTALHQLSHVWLSSSFIEARWIREGMASAVAASVADPLDAEPPFDPVAMAEERTEAAFPLDEWSGDAGRAGESYGYAASWAFIDELEQRAGAEALRTVLRRVAASMGPYHAASIEPEPTVDGVTAPASPLTSRAFLDHMETVTADPDLEELFADRVLTEADVAMLEDRAAARGDFGRLITAGGSWGTPDPVRGALTAWSFADARRQIAEALTWLAARDALLEEMSRIGLSASDRLQEAYRSYGGGSEAVSQLNAHRAVVEAYAATADLMNAPRTFVERVGLIGGPDPSRDLALANGRFAAGDLRGAVEAITEAQRILAGAETGGIVRLVSAAFVILLLLGVAMVLLRRRSSYTAAP